MARRDRRTIDLHCLHVSMSPPLPGFKCRSLLLIPVAPAEAEALARAPLDRQVGQLVRLIDDLIHVTPASPRSLDGGGLGRDTARR